MQYSNKNSIKKIAISMLQTPQKETNITNIYKSQAKSLKQAIPKLLASKSNSKQLHHGKSNKRQRMQEHPISRTIDQNTVEKYNKQEQDLTITIQRYENPEQNGYYTFNNWLDLHKQCFSFVKNQIITELWKILRIVNYGEVFIPTGLIYQITYWLLIGVHMKLKQKKYCRLKDIINQFLSNNNVADHINTFRQLANYTDLAAIQQHYIRKNEKQLHIDSEIKVKKQNQTEVFQRVFIDAKERNQRVLTNKLYQIASEVNQLKQRSASLKTIKINPELRSNKEKCQRICHDKAKYLQSNIQQINFISKRQILLKPRIPFNPSIFNSIVVEDIAGVSGHIERNKYCLAEKRRKNRIKQRY